MDGGLVDNLEEVEEKDGALVDVVECNVVVDIGVFVCDVGFNSLGFVAVANSVSVLFLIHPKEFKQKNRQILFLN